MGETFAAIDTGWRCIAAPLVKVTQQQARWLENGRECRGSIGKVIATGDEAAMRKVADRLTSAKAERHRREQAAGLWFRQEVERIRTAARQSPENRDE